MDAKTNLSCHKDDVDELHNQFPWKPSLPLVLPLLKGVHKVEEKLVLHFRDLHVLYDGGVVVLRAVAALQACHILAGGDGEVKEMTAYCGRDERGEREGGGEWERGGDGGRGEERRRRNRGGEGGTCEQLPSDYM